MLPTRHPGPCPTLRSGLIESDAQEEEVHMSLGRRHLLPRFAASSLVAFVAVGFVISWMISSQARSQTEGAATAHTEFVTSSIIAEALTPQDLAVPLDTESARYQEL